MRFRLTWPCIILVQIYTCYESMSIVTVSWPTAKDSISQHPSRSLFLALLLPPLLECSLTLDGGRVDKDVLFGTKDCLWFIFAWGPKFYLADIITSWGPGNQADSTGLCLGHNSALKSLATYCWLFLFFNRPCCSTSINVFPLKSHA